MGWVVEFSELEAERNNFGGGVEVCFGLGAKVGRRVVYYGRMAKRYGFGAPIVPFCHKVVLFRQKNN